MHHWAWAIIGVNGTLPPKMCPEFNVRSFLCSLFLKWGCVLISWWLDTYCNTIPIKTRRCEVNTFGDNETICVCYFLNHHLLLVIKTHWSGKVNSPNLTQLYSLIITALLVRERAVWSQSAFTVILSKRKRVAAAFVEHSYTMSTSQMIRSMQKNKKKEFCKNHCHSDQKRSVIYAWTPGEKHCLLTVNIYFFHVRSGVLRERERERGHEGANGAERAGDMGISQRRGKYSYNFRAAGNEFSKVQISFWDLQTAPVDPPPPPICWNPFQAQLMSSRK